MASQLEDALALTREIERLKESIPDDFRILGWTVAVHNDYWQGQVRHAFWLLTHPDGTYLVGTGLTDADALNQARTQLANGRRGGWQEDTGWLKNEYAELVEENDRLNQEENEKGVR